MSEIRYGKPNMNNLPYELGKAIFEEMDNSPKVDREALRKEADELERYIIETRRKKMNEK